MVFCEFEIGMNEIVFLSHILWVSLCAYFVRSMPFAASVCLMVLFSVLGNLMVLKQMELFGLIVTTADVYAVGVILVLNFIREKHDDVHVHTAMRYAFISLAILSLAAFTQLQYISVEGDLFETSYIQIMQQMPGLVMKSACVYWVVQFVDNKLFAWMKQLCADRYLLARVLLSLVFSQVLDTVLFSMWALGEIAFSIWDIIIFSTAVKVVCSIVMMSYTWVYERVSALFG